MTKYQWVVKKKSPFGDEFVPVNQAFPDISIQFPMFDNAINAAEGLKCVGFIEQAMNKGFILAKVTYEELPVVFIKA